MIDVKRFSGRLNRDDSSYTLPPEDYVDALNITHDAVLEGSDVSVSNVVANALVNNSLPAGTNKTIGAIANNLRNTIIFFNWNSNGYSGIYEYDKTANSISPVLLNLTDTNNIDIIGFTENNKITSINIYNRDEGDLLFFLDSLGRPTGFNIRDMKANLYNPVLRNYIDVAKNVPQSPPDCVYGDDNTKNINYLRKKFFRFKYVWEDDNFFTTTCSPISTVPIPVNVLDDNTVNLPTKNNVIYLSLNSGGANVKSVKILVSYSEASNVWSDFAVLDTIDKQKQGIADNVTFSYSFYNESVYPSYDIAQSDLLFDYVPLTANCQEMPNGNVLAYGGVTEGYNNDLTPNVQISIGSYELASVPSGTLSQVTTIIGETVFPDPLYIARTTFQGIPSPGTVIEMTVKRRADNVFVRAAIYTTVAGDTSSTAMAGVVGSFGVYNIFDSQSYNNSNTVRYDFSSVTYTNEIVVNITAPTTAATLNSTPVFKWSTQRTIGIAYFDEKGRTNGVVYSAQVIFAPYSDNSITGGVNFSSISISIYHVPPIWAVSYQFLFTKDNTGYLYFTSGYINKSEADYLYFDVTGLRINAEKKPTTAQVISYSFQDGDRVRVIKQVGSNTFFSADFDTEILGLVVDPVINNTTQTGKQFIKVKKNNYFSNTNFADNTQYELELWRPQQQSASGTNKTFFECGLQYAILNPGTAQRVHQGQLQDQSTNYVTPATFLIKEGDAYFRVRSTYFVDANGGIGQSTYNVVDRNIVDNYISGVNSFDGRPNVIDPNARQAYYRATVRHGQAYQVNTNINGLNRFYPQDYRDADYSYGDIRRLKTRDRGMRVFQTLKVGNIPLFSRLGKSPNGDEVVISTDSLLNPIQYYVGDWGIGSCPESLASFNFADYFCDNIRGAICRVSNNGIEPLSLLYKVNSWATNELPLRTGNYKIYGCFEQRQSNYIVSVEATPTSPAQTLIWDEEQNRFDSFVSYHPEMMVQLGTLFVTFKNGSLWTHNQDNNYNNFYGVQYDSYIEGIFNKGVLEKKTFLNVTEVTSKIWDCPEISTSSNSYGSIKQQSVLITQDFADLESNYSADFLRDINSNGSVLDGDVLKGNWIKIKFRAKNDAPPNNNLITLSLISVQYIDSPLTTK